MILSDKDYLIELAKGLDNAERVTLSPHLVEGAMVIKISDELAKEMSLRLRSIAENMWDVVSNER